MPHLSDTDFVQPWLPAHLHIPHIHAAELVGSKSSARPPDLFSPRSDDCDLILSDIRPLHEQRPDYLNNDGNLPFIEPGLGWVSGTEVNY